MCYLEDTSFEIIQPEEQKEIRINNEQRSMDTSQYQDRHNGGVPEEAEKAKVLSKYLVNELMVEWSINSK